MSFRLYDEPSKDKKGKKEKDVASSIHEVWRAASRKKDDGEELLKIYIDLYNSRDTQPHWDSIYKVLASELATENLEFFAANLERMEDKKFTVKQWKAFCKKWLELPTIKDTSVPSEVFLDKFIPEQSPVNLTATQLKPLIALNEEIARKYLKDNDVINFNNTHIKLKMDDPKVLTGNQILMLTAKQLLIFVNRDKYSAIDEALKDVKEDKKLEKAGKKKMEEKKKVGKAEKMGKEERKGKERKGLK